MQILGFALALIAWVGEWDGNPKKTVTVLKEREVLNSGKTNRCEEVDEDYEFLLTWFKQSRAFERSLGEVPYIWEYDQMQKVGLVRMPWRNRYYKMSRAVSYEQQCQVVSYKSKGNIRNRKVCRWVFRPRNFTRPMAKRFLDETLPLWVKYNDGKVLQINSLTRDHLKQKSLMDANYPTAILTSGGFFLSCHLLGNSIDLTGMNRRLKAFLYERFYRPWVDWDPYHKPLVVYFEGQERDEDCREVPYWKRGGAVHIDFPADSFQYGLAMELMYATDEELPWVIARVQGKLKNRPLMVVSH